jgi:hypothetical protein
MESFPGAEGSDRLLTGGRLTLFSSSSTPATELAENDQSSGASTRFADFQQHVAKGVWEPSGRAEPDTGRRRGEAKTATASVTMSARRSHAIVSNRPRIRHSAVG